MTRPHAHAPASSGSSVLPPPGRGPRLSTAHQTRDARDGTTPSRANLDQLLLALSVPKPVSYDLADTALNRLRQTAEALEVCADALLTKPGMSAAVQGLWTRIAFVLDHWLCEHRGLDATAWDTAHADALTADLTDIARTAAAIRDQIADLGPARTPPATRANPDTQTPRHRRHADPARASAVPDVAAAGPLPPGAARLLVQAAAIVAGAGIVSVVCYEAFDTGPGANRQAGEAGVSAARSVSVASHTASTPKATNATASAASTGLGTVSTGVGSLQIQLLGASAAEPRIEAVVFLDTATTNPVTVQLSYRATGGPHTVTVDRTEAGRTGYQIAFDIDTTAYCGRPVLVEAGAGGLSASQTTSAQPCAASASPSSTKE